LVRCSIRMQVAVKQLDMIIRCRFDVYGMT
jgi:hypothetical protein